MCYQWKMEIDWTRCDIKRFPSSGSAFLLNTLSPAQFLIHKTIIKFSKAKAEKALEKLVQETCNKAYLKKCRSGLFRLLHFNKCKIISHLLSCLLEAYNLHLHHLQNGNTGVLRAKRTLLCFCSWPCPESRFGQRVSSGIKPNLHNHKQNWTNWNLWLLQESQPINGLMRRALVSNYKVASSLQASIEIHCWTRWSERCVWRQNANLRIRQLHQQGVLRIWHWGDLGGLVGHRVGAVVRTCQRDVPGLDRPSTVSCVHQCHVKMKVTLRVWQPNCTLGKWIRQEEREAAQQFPTTRKHWFCGRTGLLYFGCSIRGAAVPRLHVLPTDCKASAAISHCQSHTQHLSTGTSGWLTPCQWQRAAAITTLGKQVAYQQIGSDVSALRPQNSAHPLNFMDEYKVKGNKSILP